MKMKKTPKLVKEYDLVIKTSKLNLHLLTYPLQESNSTVMKDSTIEKVSYQPDNQSLSIDYKQKDNSFTFKSSYLKNRTNYCISQVNEQEGIINLFPLNGAFQMRKEFKQLEGNQFFTTHKVKNQTGVNQRKILKDSYQQKVKQEMEQKINSSQIEQVEPLIRNYVYQDFITSNSQKIDLNYADNTSQKAKQVQETMGKPPRNSTVLKRTLLKQTDQNLIFGLQ